MALGHLHEQRVFKDKERQSHKKRGLGCPSGFISIDSASQTLLRYFQLRPARKSRTSASEKSILDHLKAQQAKRLDAADEMPAEFEHSEFLLLEKGCVSERDHRITCSMCLESYGASWEREEPFRISNCGHIFGKQCLISWAKEGKDTCPTCRKYIPNLSKILGLADERMSKEDDDIWRGMLEEWDPVWGMTGFYDAQAALAEKVFIELCEQIVSFIEDPAVSDAEEWLYSRVPFVRIINLGTFARFAHTVQNRSPPWFFISNFLVWKVRDATVYRSLMAAARAHNPRPSPNRDSISEPDETTFARLAVWHRRIAASREALYLKLYGVSMGSARDIEERLEATGHGPQTNRYQYLHVSENISDTD
ncbi:MAG: hypothetical protein Q9218_003114 [Villophora microphyllina]